MKHSQTPQDPKSSKEARARRVESLRGLTRLSRSDFAKRCGIPSGSFQNWETPRFGGLTEKAAKRVLEALRPLGIQCSLEWLMYGIEPGPKTDERLYMDTTTIVIQEPRPTYFTEDEESRLIREELLLFRQHYPNSIDLLVTEDGMEPLYKNGDYVAGRSRFQDDIASCIGMDCIVKIESGETLLRHVKKGSKAQHYTLLCHNPHTSVEKPTLYDVSLLCAAPIIWLRRRERSKNS